MNKQNRYVMNLNNQVLFYDGFSVLVINQAGRIRRVYTPFPVICVTSVDTFQIGTTLYVSEVFEDADDLLLYKISGNLYVFHHFTININF